MMKKTFVVATIIAGILGTVACNKTNHEKFPFYQEVATFDNLGSGMYAADVYGDNLYGQGYYWLDPNTGLGSKPVGDQYNMGGTAVGNFPAVTLTPETAHEWYKSQLAVDFENLRGFPGYNNTEHCLISFGCSDPKKPYIAPTINFTDTDTTTRVIDGLFVCNTSYALAQMTTDFGSGAPMSVVNRGYFKVIFTGLDASGRETGQVEAYLANYREGNTFMLRQWMPVQLTSLGRIHALKIDLQSSDTGASGMNTPAYVAIDCIVVRIDEGTKAVPNKDNIW